MLARTADNLFWLSRYVERAEYLARILEATHRVATLPVGYTGSTNEWESALSTAGCADAFFAIYNDANEENVTDFLAFSTVNPSSIRQCFEIARTNARAVRTALTTEMWDTINGAWLEIRDFDEKPRAREEIARFLGSDITDGGTGKESEPPPVAPLRQRRKTERLQIIGANRHHRE